MTRTCRHPQQSLEERIAELEKRQEAQDGADQLVRKAFINDMKDRRREIEHAQPQQEKNQVRAILRLLENFGNRW